ncbi:MAG: tetratricopeptide repeat protein [Lentisphaeria bacterium]|nr:MAG: tetratricopeptide repeat protein [Lentisphaeria bacterium]
MGDDAFAAGDYRNAVNFYSSALTLSGANPELWSAAAVKLADARLRTGDVAGAKTLLAEFRRRFPASSAGLLPGEIMIAEHDYTGAEKFFNTLAANSSDPELLCAAKFARAFSKLRQNRDLEAAFDFEEIETQNADLRRWAEQAHLARIYALIRAGKPEEAEKLLAAGKYRSAEPEGYARLGLLSALKQGNFEQFRDHWPQQQEKYGDRPDPLMYELAVEGAALAEKEGGSQVRGNAARRRIPAGGRRFGTEKCAARADQSSGEDLSRRGGGHHSARHRILSGSGGSGAADLARSPAAGGKRGVEARRRTSRPDHR